MIAQAVVRSFCSTIAGMQLDGCQCEAQRLPTLVRSPEMDPW